MPLPPLHSKPRRLMQVCLVAIVCRCNGVRVDFPQKGTSGAGQAPFAAGHPAVKSSREWAQHRRDFDPSLRLPTSCEHSSKFFFVLHNAKPHAGVMILISKRLAPAHRVTWRIVKEGRLIHARVYGNHSHINVIGYYQQAWQPRNIETCLRTRSELNSKLSRLLDECSNNQLLGGDFNTDLMPNSPYVGDAQPPAASQAQPRQSDRQQLRDLISRQGLCVLNTFQKWQLTYKGIGP